MGLSSERHDITSYEQYDGQWISFRQPVLRAARERLGETITDTRQVNPGEVWEENEFWIELSWRIDPDGSLGIRQYFESRERPGEKLTVDEYYGWMFEHSVPGLPETAEAEGLTPLEYMRRYGSYEVAKGVGARCTNSPSIRRARPTCAHRPHGRVYTRAPPREGQLRPDRRPRPRRRGPPAGRRRGRRAGPARASRPRPAGWSSTRAPWSTGAGASTPCRPTSAATSTPTRSSPTRSR
jgi:hypothetical protein